MPVATAPAGCGGSGGCANPIVPGWGSPLARCQSSEPSLPAQLPSKPTHACASALAGADRGSMPVPSQSSPQNGPQPSSASCSSVSTRFRVGPRAAKAACGPRAGIPEQGAPGLESEFASWSSQGSTFSGTVGTATPKSAASAACARAFPPARALARSDAVAGIVSRWSGGTSSPLEGSRYWSKSASLQAGRPARASSQTTATSRAWLCGVRRVVAHPAEPAGRGVRRSSGTRANDTARMGSATLSSKCVVGSGQRCDGASRRRRGARGSDVVCLGLTC